MVAIRSSETSDLTTATRPILFFRIVLQLLVTANVVPSSSILVTLMMEEIYSSETSISTGAMRRSIPEDGIARSYRRQNIKCNNISLCISTAGNSLNYFLTHSLKITTDLLSPEH
jgi:hypothetical protein